MKFILYNYSIKRIVYKIWHSELLNKSRIYHFFLNRQIKNKMNEYKNKPYCVRIENTNICNARCVMCPRDQMTRKQGIMTNELFIKIIDQCAENKINYINLHNYGEPLLDKDFIYKIKYAKSRGISKVTTNTNASLLNKEMSMGLIEAGLDELFVSIDAVNEETYKKIRVGLDYVSLVDNLLNFINIKKELKGKIKLIVSFVQSSQNKQEVKNFIKFWKKKADHISISFAHDWVGSKKNILESKRLVHPCRLLFTDLTISWNGDYILCCVDYDTKIILDNIQETKLIDLWVNNYILNNYRKNHLDNNTIFLNVCKDCTLNTVWWF